MKILCLYNNSCALDLFSWLENQGNDVILWRDKIEARWIKTQVFDLIFSYTYSHIVKKDIIDAVNGNIVNLHTSYLPWNRGVDPNMWSLIEGTPRGVTLHYIDERVDRGDIIYQEIVPAGNLEKETLRSTYDQLDFAAKDTFKKAFGFYKYWPDMRKQMEGKGTYHDDSQGLFLRDIISSYDMQVSDFLREYRRDMK